MRGHNIHMKIDFSSAEMVCFASQWCDTWPNQVTWRNWNSQQFEKIEMM